jgi:hypothetical protein
MRRRPLSHATAAALATAPDRRGAERCPPGLSASWRPLGAGDDRLTPAAVCDLSAGGIALLVTEAPRTGAIVVVQLDDPSGRLALPRVAHVKHATAQDDGRWLVGCSFAKPLPEADLAALFQSARDGVAPAAAAGPAEAEPLGAWLPGRAWERRKSARRRVPGVRVVVWDARTGTRGLGSLADVSQGGLGVVTLRPFTEGATLRVRAVSAEECVPWIEVTVRVCRRREQRWFLGCRFAGTPPALGLRLLG